MLMHDILQPHHSYLNDVFPAGFVKNYSLHCEGLASPIPFRHRNLLGALRAVFFLPLLTRASSVRRVQKENLRVPSKDCGE